MFWKEDRFLVTQRLTDESGVAIVTVLLVLVLLTLVSLTATNTTVVEKKIVRSEAVFERSFYHAESGAMEGVQKMLDEDDRSDLLASEVLPGSDNENLLRGYGDWDDPKNDLKNLDGNTAGGGNDDGVIDGNDFKEKANIDGVATYRAVVQIPIEPGQSIKTGQSRLYDYLSYGFSESGNGRSMVKVGFKKRFK